METIFTIFGIAVADAIVSQILSDTKNQNKVIWLKVSTTVLTMFVVGKELFHFLDVLRRWSP